MGSLCDATGTLVGDFYGQAGVLTWLGSDCALKCVVSLIPDIYLR